MAVLESLCVVLLLLAIVLVRHPESVLGAGKIDPESKALATNPSLAQASSVLLVSGDAPVSLTLEAKTVALTFDDGPSPDWTPRIQAVLDEYGVPGTFFVIGENVARYRDVVHDLAAAGHEIGNHTYSHPEMGALTDWQIEAQIRLTDRLIAGVTGTRPISYRPPYSGGPTYFSSTEYAAARRALGDSGALLVLSDRLPRDFDGSIGVDEVVDGALPVGGASAVITLHDAGGDRSKTVEALRILIPRLQAEGYRFVRASEIAGSAAVPPPAAPGGERALGRTLLATTSAVNLAFLVLRIVAITGVVLGLLRIAVLLFFARRFTRRRAAASEQPPYLEPVTVIIPAYNEEIGIAPAVLSMAASDYPDVRIIVVDDGSKDATSEIVRMLRLDNVTLIRQENSGKPTALNTGIAAATTDIVVLVDGDTIFDPNTVRDVVQPFRDPEVGAVAGNAKVGNRQKIITRMQHVEYTVASEIERRMYGVLGVSACVPGAIGAFRRSALMEVGGLSRDTLAEDSDLTVALARHGWAIDYVPTARAWTEAPSSWSSLLRQRRRWSYGVLQVMFKHRRALIERGRGGRLARITFPYQLLVSYALAIFAPAIDLVLLHDLIFDGRSRAGTIAIWGALNLINTGVNLYALRLDGEKFRSVWWVAFAQQFIYRQALYIAALRSIATAVLGVRMPWQTPRRVGGVSAAERIPTTADARRSEPAPDAAATGIAATIPTFTVRPRVAPVAAPSRLVVPIATLGSWPVRLLPSIEREHRADDPDWSNPLTLRTLVALLRSTSGDDVTAALAGTDVDTVGAWLRTPFEPSTPFTDVGRSSAASGRRGLEHLTERESTLQRLLERTSRPDDGLVLPSSVGLGPRLDDRPVVLAMPHPTDMAARRGPGITRDGTAPQSWGDLSITLAARHDGLLLPLAGALDHAPDHDLVAPDARPH